MDARTRLEIEIGRYIDAEMSPEERAAFERHLAADWRLQAGSDVITSAELRRVVEELSALRPRVAEAVHRAAGSIEGERIWRAVAERAAAAKRSPFEAFVSGLRLFLQPRIALATAVTVVLFGLLVVFSQLTGHQAAAEPIVTEIEYGENPDVTVVVNDEMSGGTAVVWIDGIDTDEVN
jgi:anti-sigma factor RsiW